MQLRNMGIAKIKTLQEVEPETMQNVMGANGVLIWRKANGVDESPVLPFSEQKSVSKENTFERDTIDMVLLRRIIAKMVDELAFDLRSERRVTGCITLKIRYSNFETFTKQMKISYTCSEKILLDKAMQLFQKLYSRRMLIRLIGIKFSDLVGGAYQIDLFNDVEEDLNLMQAMDGIRIRFGRDKIMRASGF